MTYNRSEIMKDAWSKHNSGRYYNFAAALQQAWREAKKKVEKVSQGYVPANTLNVGDTIVLNGVGGYAVNSFNAVITGIQSYVPPYATDERLVINYSASATVQANICVKPSETIRRVAQATAENVA